MSLGSLNIDLNANIAKFESALDRAAYVAKIAMDKVAGAATTAETAMKGLEGALGKVGLAMGTLGVVGSVGGLIELAKSSIAGAAELKHMSAQTGVSVEALSALKGVAKLTGMDLETAGQGAAKLGKAMYDAQGGSEKQRQAFKNLGIAYTDASGKLRPVGDVMLDVGKKLINSADGAGKAGIAIDLMGKKGATMIPVLEQLALRGNVNGKVTTELAERAEHLQIVWMKMVGSFNSWKFDALSAIMPALERIIPIVPKIATGLVGLFTVTKVLPMAISAVTATITTLGAATSASGLIGLGMFAKLRTAVIALNAAVLANPIVAIAAAVLAVAAAAYVFQDSLVTLGGTTASVGNWIGGVWDTVKDGVIGAWHAVQESFGKASGWFSETFGGVKGMLGKFFSWAADATKSYVNAVIGGWVGIGQAAGIVFDAIKSAWKNALDWMSGLGKDFGEGVSAALHGDVAFTAFRKRLSDAGSAAVQVGAQVKGALTDALNTDYVGKIASTAGNVFERIKQNALARKAADDAARKGRPEPKNTIQNTDSAAAAASDPYKQAMMELQRQAVGFQYVIDNWEKFGGKVRDSKAAMAEFDVTLGKFSNTERAAAKLPPLTATQKQAYIEAAKAVQELELREKQLIALKKFDDSVKKINEETAGLKESAVQREINGQLVQLEAAGIKKGTDEYIRRKAAMTDAIQAKRQTEFDVGMTEYFAQQKIGIDNEQFMISLLGKDSLAVAKLTEAHRIDAEVQDKIRQARRDGVILSDEEIAKQLQQADAIKQTRLAQIDLAAAIQRTPEFGARQAFLKYREAANDMGSQVENAITSGLKGAEDAFVEFTQTGKLSFKSLINSISADMARMSFKQMMSGAFDWLKGGGLGEGIAGLFKGAAPTAAQGATTAVAATAKQATDAVSTASQTASITALGTAATTSSTALGTMSTTMTALTGAAQSAATALTALSTSKAGGSAGALASAGNNTGALASSDLGAGVLANSSPTAADLAGQQSKATESLSFFDKQTVTTASDVLKLASAAGEGGNAMGRLPGIVGLFQSAVAAMQAGGSSGGGGIGGFIANLFGASGGEAASYETAAAVTGIFHSGGIVGQPPATRNVSMDLFAGAPRYHTGGLVGKAADRVSQQLKHNEVAAILMGGPKGKREEVLRADDPRHRDNLGMSIVAKILNESRHEGLRVRAGREFRGLAGAADGIDFGGFFADGGDPPVGRVSLVGERGPELFVPKTAGTILPNDFMKSLAANHSQPQQTTVVHQVINFHNNGPVTRQTQQQIAAAAYRGSARASSRNN